VPSKGKSAITLQECLIADAEESRLDFYECPNCEVEGLTATMRVRFYKLPQILIVQLKRFSGGGGSYKKNDAHVVY
jgi:ubiquitin C-terminal hydrolase